MTDTIGWGEVDDPPRRPSWLRLNRRRRIALAGAAVLVAGGVVAWPPVKSWRADAAAGDVQHIWARAEGYDNARVVALAGAQRTLGVLDQPLFARAVAQVETEEAAALDRLGRQAKAIRTWTADVAAARKAVVAAMAAQAKALRTQAGKPAAIAVELPITAALDADSSAAAVAADERVHALEKRHHLKPLVPSTERFRSAVATLAQLRRPTDEPLPMRLVTIGADGITVTDLDTGHVVRRLLDGTDTATWQAERVLGESVVGSVDNDTLIVPLDPGRPERRIRDAFPRSSTGSPMWLASLSDMALVAVDEAGRRVGRPVTLPEGTALTGAGTGSVLLATTPPAGEFNGPRLPAPFYLVHPGSAGRVDLAVSGCGQQPALDGGIVVLPSGNICDYTTRLQLFDLSGRLVRTAPFPDGDVSVDAPVCSPDGAHVAIVTYARPPNGEDSTPTRIRVLDVKSGKWSTVDGTPGWFPLGWSRDGTALLFQAIDSAGFVPNQQFGQLAYLRLGDMTLHSIRVAADQTNFLI